MNAKFPVFIVGAQRSGTTLLRLLLNSHSMIAIPEEARFLMPLLEQDKLLHGFQGEDLHNLVNYLRTSQEFQLWNYDNSTFLKELEQLKQISLVDFIGKLYSSYALSESKQYWADKSLFFRRIDILANMFPQGSFINIVRDGRDVFDSWRKMDTDKDCAPAAALDWRLKLSLIERAFSRLPTNRTLTIRFEDLLIDPESVAKLICTFLGLKYEESMLSFHENSNRYVGEHHSKLIFKPIDSSNQFKWRNNLTHLEKIAFDLVAGKQLDQYNYGRSGEKCSLVDRISTLSRLINGGVGRAREILRDATERRRALQSGSATSSIKIGTRPSERQ